MKMTITQKPQLTVSVQGMKGSLPLYPVRLLVRGTCEASKHFDEFGDDYREMEEEDREDALEYEAFGECLYTTIIDAHHDEDFVSLFVEGWTTVPLFLSYIPSTRSDARRLRSIIEHAVEELDYLCDGGLTDDDNLAVWLLDQNNTPAVLLTALADFKEQRISRHRYRSTVEKELASMSHIVRLLKAA